MKAIELYRNNDHIILVTAIEFRFLKDIVKFTQRKSSNWSDKIEENNSSKFYQRETNEIRVKSIKKYISNSLFNDSNNNAVLFPSSMILSMDAGFNEFEKRIDNTIDFALPFEKESSLIVDGQHRLKAMFALYNELNEGLFKDEFKIEKVLNYKYNCTILKYSLV